MWLILLLIIFVWVSKRNSAPAAVASSAGLYGGWHAPRQTIAIGGQNLIGNQFDNGTAQGQIPSQWLGYDDAGPDMVYALAGGEDGQNPSLPSLAISRTEVTTLPRFRMLGGGDPRRIAMVPVNVTTLNDVVRR